MHLICDTEVSLCVSVISDLIGAFVPFWHTFKNSVTTEIRLPAPVTSHKQPFLLPHNCEIGDLPGVASTIRTSYLLHVAPVWIYIYIYIYIAHMYWGVNRRAHLCLLCLRLPVQVICLAPARWLHFHCWCCTAPWLRLHTSGVVPLLARSRTSSIVPLA